MTLLEEGAHRAPSHARAPSRASSSLYTRLGNQNTVTLEFLSFTELHQLIIMHTSKRLRTPDLGDDEVSKRVRPNRTTAESPGWASFHHVHTTEQLLHITQSWAPLIGAVESGSTSPEECGRMFHRALSNSGPGSALSKEAFERSFLHMAARIGRPKALEVMMSGLPHTIAPDANGRTALQALLDELERQRRLLGDRFDGFSQDYIRCLSVLSDVRVIDISQLQTWVVEKVLSPDSGEGGSLSDHNAVVQTLRFKYGCTCGLCIGGFLSPRMFLVLELACVDIGSALKSDELSTGSRPWGEIFSRILTSYDGKRQERVRNDRLLSCELVYMFGCIADCVRNKWAPTRKNFIDHYPGLDLDPETNPRTYDTVEVVFTSAFEAAMACDERAGDGHHRREYGDRIDALPACRNDHEFGFASRMCGYGSLSVFRENETGSEMEM